MHFVRVLYDAHAKLDAHVSMLFFTQCRVQRDIGPNHSRMISSISEQLDHHHHRYNPIFSMADMMHVDISSRATAFKMHDSVNNSKIVTT